MNPAKSVAACGVLIILMAQLLQSVSQIPPQNRPTDSANTGSVSQVITFEDIKAPSPREGQRVLVTTEYKDKGIAFKDALVFSYPQDFAHSGTNAIQICTDTKLGCGGQLTMTFTRPTTRVKLWLGDSTFVLSNGPPSEGMIAIPTEGEEEVRLTASSKSGTVVDSQSIIIPASTTSPTGVIRVVRSVELRSTDADISAVEVGVKGTSGLALDDVEFDLVPDLTFDKIESNIDPQKVSITATVKNIGQAPSEPTTIESRFLNLTVHNDLIGLQPGEVATVTMNAPRAQLQPEDSKATIVIDPESKIADSDRANNTEVSELLVPPNKPDLTVQISNSGVDASQKTYAVVRVTNIGIAASPATEVQITSAGRTLGVARVQALQPRQSVELTITLTGTQSGQNALEASVDPKHVVDDADPTNNVAKGVLVVPGAGAWWRDPRVLVTVGLGVLLIGIFSLGLVTYKLIRRPGDNSKKSIPAASLPVFYARPRGSPGTQQLRLSGPASGGIGMQVRFRLGDSQQQLHEETAEVPKGTS